MNQTADTQEIQEIDRRLKLFVYFKPGQKYEKWHWYGSWLKEDYEKKTGKKLPTQYEAVIRKIETIYWNCARILVFDNRPETISPVVLEIVNGRLVLDNRNAQEKIRRPLRIPGL
ncbi:MAG: hypothetical protein LCH37_14835 [Bacteroidetes bacterium]|nr:hypothetical protein [Bacteroidota bacterium]